MSSTYLGSLTTLKDPRTFFVAEPAAALVAAGKAPNSYDAFMGAGSGEDLATMSSNAGLGKYSFINRKRYYQTYTAEKTTQVGYQEMCFNIAEAVNRGWISTQNAETWYQNGIKASQAFYGVKEGANTVIFQKPGGTLAESVTYSVDFSYATYYAQSTVKYAGNNADGLKQILMQKYLSLYQNSGAEGYYNWRRTGVPTFHTGLVLVIAKELHCVSNIQVQKESTTRQTWKLLSALNMVVLMISMQKCGSLNSFLNLNWVFI